MGEIDRIQPIVSAALAAHAAERVDPHKQKDGQPKREAEAEEEADDEPMIEGTLDIAA